MVSINSSINRAIAWLKGGDPKPPERRKMRPAAVRSNKSWDPGKLKKARARADTGDLSMLGLLVDELRADDRIKGALQVLTGGLLGLPLGFDVSGVGRRRGAVAKAVDEDWWDMCPEPTLRQLLTWGLMAGVGIAHMNWDLDEATGRWKPTLTVFHPRWYRFDWRQRVWQVVVDGGERLDVDPDSPEWLMFLPWGNERPWADGLWWSVARWWMQKSYARDDWAIYSEVHGRPIKSIKTADNVTDERRHEVAAEYADQGSDGVWVLPPGWEASLVEGKGQSAKCFRDQIKDANTSNVIAILGQNLTTEVEGGSHAAAQVHDRVRMDILKFYAEALSTCLNAGVLRPWADFNFGAARLAPWPVWDTTPPADKKAVAEAGKAQADTVVAFINAVRTAKEAGIPLDVSTFAESVGVPLLEEGQSETLRLSNRESDPFQAGIKWVDALTDTAIIEAGKLQQGFIGDIVSLADGHSDFEAFRAATLTAYLEYDEGPAIKLAHQIALITALAGQAAVLAEIEADTETTALSRRGRRLMLAGPPEDLFEAPTEADRFDEAVDWWRDYVGISDADMEALEAETLTRAEVVSRGAQLSFMGDLWAGIDAAVEDGETFEDFKKPLEKTLTEAWGDETPRRLETIFRNLTASTYNAGRFSQMTADSVLQVRPYWLLDVILDEDTSPICQALVGTLLKHDDPFWESHWPQLHHRCRTGVRAMTEAAAKRRGITQTPPDEDADKGFGKTPPNWDWRPEPKDYPAELFDAHREKGGQ